jgi:hypothetical protein
LILVLHVERRESLHEFAEQARFTSGVWALTDSSTQKRVCPAVLKSSNSEQCIIFSGPSVTDFDQRMDDGLCSTREVDGRADERSDKDSH